MLSLSTLVQIEKLRKQLDHYRGRNAIKTAYYESRNRLKSLGISLPPALEGLDVSLSWPGIIVDYVDERMNFQGFYGDSDELGINDIFVDNNMMFESSQAHIPMLVYGTSYNVVGKGDTSVGEPDVLITTESPNNVVGEYNLRTRRLNSALQYINTGNKQEAIGTLFTAWANIPFMVSEDGEIFEDGPADEHNLGQVLVTRFVNKPQASNTRGRSEITPVIMDLTDMGLRTLAAMETGREFFATPQRWIMGASADEFKTTDGQDLNPWTALMNKVWVASGDSANGQAPTVGQFEANSPEPFIKILDRLAQEASAASGIPLTNFGVKTEGNPPSADAIKAVESTGVKRTERKIMGASQTWKETAKLAALVKFGYVPEELKDLDAIWLDPSTPTRAANADEAQKLIAAGVLTADSEVTWNRIGLSAQERKQLLREKEARERANLLENLAKAAQGAKPLTVSEPIIGTTP